MKKLKNVLLPAIIILIGAGAAFATSAAKNSDDELEDGYYLNSATQECTNSFAKCSPTGSVACSWSDGGETHNLFRINGTSCVRVLYEPQAD